MARTRRRFLVEATLLAKDKASRVLSRAEGRLKKLTGAFSKFPRVAGLAGAALVAFGAASVNAIRDAIELDKQFRRLDNALARFGGNTSAVNNALRAQAGALSTLTGHTDTTVVGMQALLAQMGVVPGQLEEATRAAVNLDAALGIGLESAARNIGRTMGGFAGELSELIPELKQFSAEALRSGEGITFLAEKFAGVAEETQTAGTAFTNLSNAMSDLGRGIASPITSSDRLQASLEYLTFWVQQLTPNVAVADGRIGNLDTTLQHWKGTVDDGVATLGKYLEALGRSDSQIADTIRNFRTMVSVFGSVSEAWERMRANMERATDVTTRQASAVENARAVFKTLGITLEQDVVKQVQEAEASIESLEHAFRSGFVSVADYERGTDRLRAKIEVLNGSLEAGAVAAKADAAALRELDRATGAAGREIDDLSRKTEKNTRATERNNTAQRAASQVRYTNATLSGGTFTTLTLAQPTVLPSGEVIWLLPGQRITFAQGAA